VKRDQIYATKVIVCREQLCSIKVMFCKHLVGGFDVLLLLITVKLVIRLW